MTALVSVVASASLGVAQQPFVDASDRWGLDFVHETGATGALLFPEIMGAGAVLFDYDGDGDLDAYLVQSGAIEAAGEASAAPLTSGRLYRQDRSGATASFVDVTERSSIDDRGYGIGAAVGDVDGDGWLDLFVTHFGPDRLWRNRGDGTFEDWTERAGVAGERWSSSASFFDFDGDGRLDLYVADYVHYDPADPPTCYTANTSQEYCGPTAFDPLPDRLYRNLGDGHFEDVSLSSGIGTRAGAGLGVVALDIDDDADLDLVVANDQMENFVWLNRGDGTFEEAGLWWGVALNLHGRPEASMGIAPADFDGDGSQDLLLTHLNGESNTLYLNGGETFLDRSRPSGLAGPSLGRTGFGVAWIDVDDDGWTDLWVANGEVRALEPLVARAEARPYHQPDQLFHNQGEARFLHGLGGSGGDSALSETGRGVAIGDVDGDGDDDLLVSNNHGRARLLLDTGSGAGAVTVRAPSLESTVGLASASVAEAGRPLQRRWLRRDGSFASSSDARWRFALSEDTASVEVVVPGPVSGRLRLGGAPAGSDIVLDWRPGRGAP